MSKFENTEYGHVQRELGGSSPVVHDGFLHRAILMDLVARAKDDPDFPDSTEPLFLLRSTTSGSSVDAWVSLNDAARAYFSAKFGRSFAWWLPVHVKLLEKMTLGTPPRVFIPPPGVKAPLARLQPVTPVQLEEDWHCPADIMFAQGAPRGIPSGVAVHVGLDNEGGIDSVVMRSTWLTVPPSVSQKYAAAIREQEVAEDAVGRVGQTMVLPPFSVDDGECQLWAESGVHTKTMSAGLYLLLCMLDPDLVRYGCLVRR